MTESTAPPDQAARDDIAIRLDDTLFVEAGAGSGKTSSLIDRLMALIVTGSAELRSIAAITFSEKAGAELRDRLRRSLQERDAAEPDHDVAARCRVALEQLDSAAIGTLHSFAQRILSENPIEARLPPQVDVLDEVSSGVEFDHRWSVFRDQLIEDTALERTLLLLLAAGVRSEALGALAAAFEADWDLVAERVPAVAPNPPPVRELLGPLLDEFDAVCDERFGCLDEEDRLSIRLEQIAEHVRWLRSITDELDVLAAIGSDPPVSPPSFKAGGTGRKANWTDITAVRARVTQCGEQLERVRDTVANACAHRLGSAIRVFTLASADERRAAGKLEFHDLLVLARALLRDPVNGPVVRARLHGRYQRLLLDEFQDTDPIQIELAVRIAAADPSSNEAGAAPWTEVEVTPGQLFVVGDPKQSIYRFRRADIVTFLRARHRFGDDAHGEVVALTANFRSAAPIIGWVNHVFETLMSETPDLALPIPSQPDYLALDAERGNPPIGPAVAVISREPHAIGTSADDLRAAEAAEVAATIARAINEGWSVHDDRQGSRPARLGDITVLVPARTSVPFLQDCLDASHIPYRAESSSLVYATRAVRDVLMVLRAVDDPTNQLHILSALRTPLLACGDDDLLRFRVERHGRWSYLTDQPDTVPHDDPVRRGLAYLRELYERRHWSAPSELIDTICRDRRALELGFAEGRPRDVWRRLRFISDQARAWADATNGSLRQYLHWVALQAAEGSRVTESILPETDDDAVRIMTIHGAKGLEFPITIVSGMSTVPGGRRAAAEVVFPPDGDVGYHFGTSVRTDEYNDFKPIDEQMGYDERIRLLYVACTRARDHLVVSLCRKERRDQPATIQRTNAELLVVGMGDLVDDIPDAISEDDATVAIPARARPEPLMSIDEWETERAQALSIASRPTAVAATALSEEGLPDTAADLRAGLQKRPRDQDLPPWLKGRYGSAVGRAVHGTLQTIDLPTGAGLLAAVAAQCQAEAIPDRADQVRFLVEAALRSPSVRAAAVHEHWREVYVCTPIEDRLLEGYIDLLYRKPDGLVVVDYKTSASDDTDELDRRMLGYRLQGASYALAVGSATGERVSSVIFLFLTPSGPVERELDELDAATAEVRSLVEAGREIEVDELETAG